ncbi:MAG: heavy metal translocating P-type ATPase [Desulfobulbus propionicus]|nr:MAG: heavy metal translocating P-type ATPase [Desulfobulbus propionicus]
MDVSSPHGKTRLTPGLLHKAGVKVKQSMPGRFRVRVTDLCRRRRQQTWMKTRLTGVTGVSSVETRFATGSVIVIYDDERTQMRTLLLEIVEQVLQPVIYPEAPPLLSRQLQSCDTCLTDSQQSFSQKRNRVIWLSGFMAYVGLRSWMFKLPLLQSPLSLIGVVAMAGIMPLLKEAADDTFTCHKMTVKPLLACGAVITIAMGEAFSALQILWIYNVAELTEEYVAQRSRQAIRDMLEVAPANAYVMVDGMELETPVADIRPGDVVAVHTGEKLPVDGVVTDGEALVDEATINGRAEAVLRSSGDVVYAGTSVSQGILFIKTTKTGEDTYLAHIMQMVEDSLVNRAPVEQRADQLAARLLKIGVAATAMTLLLTGDPLRALTVMLVMSCPCATVLAASSAVTAALANAAKNSILIKGGLYLEAVGKAEVYCFDKTGTLTTEQPKIVRIIGRTPTITEEALLVMAATAESHNQHPMAKAILAEAQARELLPDRHAVCEFKPGRGVLCTVGGDAVILVGNKQFMEEHQVDVRWFDRASTTLREAGNTVVYISRNGKAQGMMAVANPIRVEAVSTLHSLIRDGVKQVHLVTGDSDDVARSLLQAFPFDDCRSALMPEAKAAWIKEIQQAGQHVVMVGDGVNDALALACADIGVAMGAAGAEVAMEAADIALADSNLEGLMKVRNLSHKTMAVIDQNHYLAIGTDLFGAALGMAGVLSPILAGMIHIFHTGGILINSSRLLSWEPPVEPLKRE